MDGVDHLRDLNVEGSITVKLILIVVRECGQDLFGWGKTGFAWSGNEPLVFIKGI